MHTTKHEPKRLASATGSRKARIGLVPGHRSDGLLVDAMVVAVNLAVQVAKARIEKADRKKSRCRSVERLNDRVQKTWLVVLNDAARMNAEHAGNPERHALKVIRQLHIELALATRGRGRPRRDADEPADGTGMLASIGSQNTQAGSPRPTSGSLLRKFYGRKLRLYVRCRVLAGAITPQGAIAHLRREAHAIFGQRTFEGVTKALDAFVSDRMVANDENAEALFGASGAKFAKRMQRDREKFGFVLPLGGI